MTLKSRRLRVFSTIVGGVLVFFSIADVPEQAEKWRRGLVWVWSIIEPSFTATTFRTAIFVAGVIVLVWAWLPQGWRSRSRLGVNGAAETGGIPKPIAVTTGLGSPSESETSHSLDPTIEPPFPASIKVRATQMGFYGNVRRRPGNEFSIASERDFSRNWMERVGPTPLTVELSFRKNEGGTPGVHLMVRNSESDALHGAVASVFDIRLWSEELQRFVTTPEVYGHEKTFTEIQLGQATLHPVKPEQMAFIRSENNRIEVRRHGPPPTKGNPNIEGYTLRSHGIWRFSFRVRSAEGRTIDQPLCLSWNKDVVLPAPCRCPPYPIVSSAPAPHSPVR